MYRSWDQQIERLIRCIEAGKRDTERPFVVSIDGRSGSGKSTLAEILRQKVNAEIISGDDFFAGGENVTGELPEALAHICIDWQAQRKVLQQIHLSEAAYYYPYDWATFDGSKMSVMTRVEASDVVVLEGVYSARSELRDLVDLTVLLKIPNEERMRRLLEREGQISPWEQQWHRAEDWYFASSAHREAFDIVLEDLAAFPK